MYQRRPSPTWAKTLSQRDASKYLIVPFQLSLLPRVAQNQAIADISPASPCRLGLQCADEIGQAVIAQMRELRGQVGALAREADEISEVVEPLQGATERVGKVAARLPGGGQKD